MKNKQSQTIYGVRGFTLIEMLVAVVVLSVGLLGLASLQANGLRMNDSAYFRSQALALGSDILDRMRGNSASALAGDYDTTAGGFGGDPAGAGLALTDVQQWQALIDNLLPGDGTSNEGEVFCAGARLVCTVTVRWDDSRAAGAAANQSIQLRSQL